MSDPLLTAFIEATDKKFENDKHRRAVVMMGARKKLIDECVAVKAKQNNATNVNVSLPIVAEDNKYFVDIAARINEVLDFPADPRVTLTAAVYSEQKCVPSCKNDYAICGCPYFYRLSITLKRIKN
jgi:hypothetical protein